MRTPKFFAMHMYMYQSICIYMEATQVSEGIMEVRHMHAVENGSQQENETMQFSAFWIEQKHLLLNKSEGQGQTLYLFILCTNLGILIEELDKGM